MRNRGRSGPFMEMEVVTPSQAQRLAAHLRAAAVVLDEIGGGGSTVPVPVKPLRRRRGPVPPTEQVSEVDAAAAKRELFARGLHVTTARHRNG